MRLLDNDMPWQFMPDMFLEPDEQGGRFWLNPAVGLSIASCHMAKFTDCHDSQLVGLRAAAFL